MTREALREGRISEESCYNALIEAKGDLFVASCVLGVTGRELDSYIRRSEALQAIVAGIGVVKANADYKRMSSEQFQDEFERLNKQYRVEAVNEIHKIATMDVPLDKDANAALVDVKLKAAVQLRGPVVEAVQTNSNTAVLDELNQLYQAHAPRIKTVRAVQIEYQS